MGAVSAAGRDTAGQQAARIYNEGDGSADAVTTATGATATTAISDPSAASISVITLHGATPVLQLPAPRVGAKKVLILVQDATGSRIPSYTSAGGGTVTWVGSAALTLQTAAGKKDRVVADCYEAGIWVLTGGGNLG